MVIGDSEGGNVNGEVDGLLEGEEMTGVLAQVEATFSNSVTEAFWRARKRSWPHLNNLDNSGCCYCNGPGPECHESRLVWIAVAAIFARCVAVVL